MFLPQRFSALLVAASGIAFLGAATIPRNSERSRQARAANELRLEAKCQVRGVWELVSVSLDGKDQPLAGYKQMKVLTDRRFMWIGQAARRDTLPLKTQMDTLRAYQIGGGAGTYTTSGNTYIEHLDLFAIPSWVGTSFKATCRTEGGRWYHSFTQPNDTTKAPGPYQHIIEVWRRVE
jgi:hypothetical protein